MERKTIIKGLCYLVIISVICVCIYFGITALMNLFTPGKQTQLALDCSQSDSSLMECCKPGGELFNNVKKLYQDKNVNLTDDQITRAALFFFCSGRKKDNLKSPPMCSSHLNPPK